MKTSIIIIIVLILSLLCGCSITGNDHPNTGDLSNTAENENSAEDTAHESSGEPDSQQTGEATGEQNKYADPGNIHFTMPQEGTRPVAVMIDNEGKLSYPQGGINMAQVVYEAVAENGETRMMPLFWGAEQGQIGPVRSSRHYFLDYVLENDAIYVHVGWSPRAQYDIGVLKLNNINGVANSGNIFFDLTSDRSNYQDTYTTMEKINAYIDKVRYRTDTKKEPVFKYGADIGAHSQMPEQAKQALKIKIDYSRWYSCGYEYDSISGEYIRIRNGKPHIEKTTGEPLITKNVIIQYVENWTIKGDKQGRQDLRTVGSGKGYFVTQGKAAGITWSKAGRSSPTVYAYADGTPVVFNPGVIWVQIVPLYSKVIIE